MVAGWKFGSDYCKIHCPTSIQKIQQRIGSCVIARRTGFLIACSIIQGIEFCFFLELGRRSIFANELPF
jgi:hypothetical protein